MKHSRPTISFFALALLACLPILGGCKSSPQTSASALFSEPQILGKDHEWRMYPVLIDFNADGILDIVATHRRPLYENSLHIWLGNAEHTFTDQKQTWTSPGYSGLGVGDINGDGKLDIISASHFNRVQTLINKGDGTFTESALPTVDGYIVARLVDLHHDGHLEAVLLGNEKAGIEIYERDDKNAWILKTTLEAGNIGRDLQIIDMNKDGLLDLVASMSRRGIVIYLQDKNGKFTQAPDTNFYSATQEFRSFTTADVNNDGWPDIVINGGFAGILKPNGPDVYLADGKGGWVESSEGLKVFKKPAEGVAVADFNHDGFQDFVAGGNISGEFDEKAYGLFLFAGDGKGHWKLVKDSGLPERGLPRNYGIATADMNGDKLSDLVINHGAPEEGSGYISVWFGKK
jgi:hypothetical protein